MCSGGGADGVGPGAGSVPEVVYADGGGDLLGEPFILTRFASGVPLTSVFAGAAEEDGPQLAEAVAVVLDWEYAFSGSGLFDLGNMPRFPQDLSPGFAEHFPGAYEKAGGALPGRWQEISEALDLFALSDLLTRSPDHPLFAQAAAIRQRLTRHR